jgi:hypothetical protein
MLCHQHPADSAHAACQRCQRGLCRGCTQQFLQRLCTHCIEQSAAARKRDARRTLWLALPVFALAAWGTSQGLFAIAPRLRLYFALLAGMAALGVWLGLRRWRRAPQLTSGFAVMPEGEAPFVERVLVPALAGLVFWPWLLFETLHDMQLANRLRAFVPPENRVSSFGFGEASLAFASLAASFTLGTHGLSSYAPTAGKLWAGEAKLAQRAQDAVRAKLDEPAKARLGSMANEAPAAPVAHAVEAPTPEGEPQPQPEVPPLPVVPEAPAQEAPPRAHPHRKREEITATAEEAEPASADHEEPAPEEEAPPPILPPPVLDRRYVPGSEMAKQAQSGNNGPDGYVTPSGRVVIKAPPPK